MYALAGMVPNFADFPDLPWGYHLSKSTPGQTRNWIRDHTDFNRYASSANELIGKE